MLNLVPAGKYLATKLTTKSNHVKHLPAKWIQMATKLSTVDPYQNSKFTNSKYKKCSIMCDTEYKQIALKKVILYLKDSKMSAPGNLYPVMVLETVYSKSTEI